MLKIDSVLRTKKRYILLSGNKDEIEKSIIDYLGSLGWAKANPIFLNEGKDKIIMAVERKELNNVRASFEVSNFKIKILGVSGTLKRLERFN